MLLDHLWGLWFCVTYSWLLRWHSRSRLKSPVSISIKMGILLEMYVWHLHLSMLDIKIKHFITLWWMHMLQKMVKHFIINIPCLLPKCEQTTICKIVSNFEMRSTFKWFEIYFIIYSILFLLIEQLLLMCMNLRQTIEWANALNHSNMTTNILNHPLLQPTIRLVYMPGHSEATY